MTPPPPVIKLLRLSVQNATQRNVADNKTWAAVKADKGEVLVEATTGPQNNEAEWKQIKWSPGSGEPCAGRVNCRKVPLSASKKYRVEASLGGVTEFVDVCVLWATIAVLTKGLRPTNAAPFDPGTRDNSDKLGAVSYKSPVSSVIDEEAGIFVDDMGASGKVCVVASLSPKGIGKLVNAGWLIQRQLITHDWIDGVATKQTTDTWARDTSNPRYLRLKPDADDKIYDTDAPDLRWGAHSGETYNNFRQWVEWNGERCSDYALWYWQARWRLDRDLKKQITLMEAIAGKNMKLPEKPFYPPPKGQ